MNKELNKYSNLAQTILNLKTRYQTNKKIIQDVFEISNVISKDVIQFRLTVIDSYYSTQILFVNGSDIELKEYFTDSYDKERHLREIYFSSPNFEKVNFSELELT